MASANSIKVVARFRPQNKIELNSGGEPIVSFAGPDTCSINVRLPVSQVPCTRTLEDANIMTATSLVGRSRG